MSVTTSYIPERCDMGAAVKYLHSRENRTVWMIILFGKSKQFTSLSFVPDSRDLKNVRLKVLPCLKIWDKYLSFIK
jgi:hypothetical protein